MSVPIDTISTSSSKFNIHANKAVVKPIAMLDMNGVLNLGKSLDKNEKIRPSFAIE